MQHISNTEFWKFHSEVIEYVPYDAMTTEQGSYVDELCDLNFGKVDVEETVQQIDLYLKTLEFPF